VGVGAGTKKNAWAHGCGARLKITYGAVRVDGREDAEEGKEELHHHHGGWGCGVGLFWWLRCRHF